LRPLPGWSLAIFQLFPCFRQVAFSQGSRKLLMLMVSEPTTFLPADRNSRPYFMLARAKTNHPFFQKYPYSLSVSFTGLRMALFGPLFESAQLAPERKPFRLDSQKRCLLRHDLLFAARYPFLPAGLLRHRCSHILRKNLDVESPSLVLR